MTHNEILKLKAATLYILQKCGEVDFIHLFKTLYFAERNHYAYYGQHLVNDTFCALPKGPVPSFLYDAVKVACGSKPSDETMNVIASALVPGEGECQYYYVHGKEAPDMDELSEADIESLDKAIEVCSKMDSDALSKESHDEAWAAAYHTRVAAPMNPLSIAKAGGASDGFVAYIKEQEHLAKLLA